MPRYEYKCSLCQHVQEEIHSMTEVGNQDMLDGLVCYGCGVSGSMEQLITGGQGFQKVASMTPEERKEVLKKRSHDHFKKNVEEQFHVKNKPGFMP
jgi:hypothetical protein